LVTQEGSEGLYSTVDIAYDSVANELTLTKSTSVEGETTSTTVKLNNGISIIERIEYDPVTEEIVIYYKTTSGEEERFYARFPCIPLCCRSSNLQTSNVSDFAF
jgi:hypothetical protein